jgi:hypothetical protein
MNAIATRYPTGHLADRERHRILHMGVKEMERAITQLTAKDLAELMGCETPHTALGMENPEGIVWFWIGSHAEYDKLLR